MCCFFFVVLKCVSLFGACDFLNMSGRHWKWLQQNAAEIDALYCLIHDFRENNPGTLLASLTYDRYLSFVLSSSDTHPNPYLPVHADVESHESEVESGEEVAAVAKPVLAKARQRADELEVDRA